MVILASVPGFITALIVVGGALSVVFTVRESGAIGAIYAIITGLVMILVGCASALRNIFGQSLRLHRYLRCFE
jgi:TRAP-type C4-dicarboxylate transport system permease large subunit